MNKVHNHLTKINNFSLVADGLIESHIGLKVGFMWLGLYNLDELGRVLNSCPKCYTPRNIFRKM